MVKAKDLSDSVDGKYSKEDAKEEADRSKKTSIKVVSISIRMYYTTFYYIDVFWPSTT